jgi:hypothetical protein
MSYHNLNPILGHKFIAPPLFHIAIFIKYCPGEHFDIGHYYVLHPGTWISNIMCGGLFCVQLRWEVIVRFVDISWINDHYYLNFLFIITKSYYMCHLDIINVLSFMTCK